MAVGVVDSAFDWQRDCQGPEVEDANHFGIKMQQAGDVDADVDMRMEVDGQQSPRGHRHQQELMSRSSVTQEQIQGETQCHHHLLTSDENNRQILGPDQQANLPLHLIPRSHPDIHSPNVLNSQPSLRLDTDNPAIVRQLNLVSSDIELDSDRDEPVDSAVHTRRQARLIKSQTQRDADPSDSGSQQGDVLIRTRQGQKGSISSIISTNSGKGHSANLGKGRGKGKRKAEDIFILASSPSNTHPSLPTKSSALFQSGPPDLNHYSHKLHRSPLGHTHPHAFTTSPPFTRQSSTFIHHHNSAPLSAYQSPTPPAPIRTPSNTTHRPDPLRITSSSSSASASSSLRSARRLTHSPYLVPATARFAPSRTSSSPNMVAATPMITVKDEPHTPVPLPTSPDGIINNETTFDLPLTPQHQRSVHSPGSRIGTSPGSMSMSQRRGVKPSFPGARVPTRGGPATRGLPTPLCSASSSRQPPYPSPVPLLTAPLSPTNANGSKWHQSAPAVPMTAIPTKPPHQPNPYQVSLDEIPKDFVLKKLVQLASKYWYAPHSADCHIIVPIKRQFSSSPKIPSTPKTAIPPLHQRQSQNSIPQTAGSVQHDASQPGSGFWGRTVDPISENVKIEPGLEEDVKPDVLSSSVKTTTQGLRDPSARRGSLPGDNHLEQCLVFPLHRDYLTTQSVLFRTLLNSQAAQISNPPPRDENGRLLFQSPVIRGAKVLPTKADRPKALYVPLPDPASFGVILHWLYWHDVDHFNHCLSKGLVTWQGVIRNIEYLALDNEIKLLAGKWWKRWVKPTDPAERRNTGAASVNGLGSGKKRAMSVSTGLKRPVGHDDDDDDDEEEDDEGGNGIDSGDEADEEDLEVDGAGAAAAAGKTSAMDDSFADHVSARFGRL